jgi:hypothetical protein
VKLFGLLYLSIRYPICANQYFLEKYLLFDILLPVAYNWSNHIRLEGGALVQGDEPGVVGEEPTLDIEQVKRHLDMLDQRLDNIDSVVTAIVERVMKQPIAFTITCPNCGKSIEIAIIGSQKPTR